MSFFDRIKASIQASIGDIVFGMEDGTVSIFGLVFGVALSASDSHTVVLAGATGAAAAAVSMMAGAYLDAESERDEALARTTQSGAAEPEKVAANAVLIADRLVAGGVPQADAQTLQRILARTPGAIAALRQETSPAVPVRHASPAAHAFWMFVADLFAGAVPVMPFALLPLPQARIASLVVTTALLLILGVGRGLVAGRNIVRTTIETIVVAAAAAAAGVAIGRVIS